VRSAVADRASQPVRNLAWVSMLNGSGATVTTDATINYNGLPARKLVPTVQDGFAYIGTDIGAIAAGMKVGGTYTVVAYIYLAAPQAGSLHARARRAVFFQNIPGFGYVESQSSQAPNTVGWHRVSLTFTIQTDATEAFVRLYNGSGSSTDIVYWAGATLVEGTVAPQYPLHGGLPGWRWTGAANGSQSIGHPLPDIRQLPPVSGPVYSDAGGSAGFFTTGNLGPTGTVAGRMSRGPGGMGWGAYLAADLSYPGNDPIPGGTPIEITWWQRASAAGANQVYQIIDDPAANSVTAGQNYVATTAWTKYTFTATTLIDWTPALHRFRTGLVDTPNGWIEISDVKLKVLP
jgi:hypothetical protein